jgi:hypothetical protein
MGRTGPWVACVCGAWGAQQAPCAPCGVLERERAHLGSARTCPFRSEWHGSCLGLRAHGLVRDVMEDGADRLGRMPCPHGMMGARP